MHPSRLVSTKRLIGIARSVPENGAAGRLHDIDYAVIPGLSQMIYVWKENEMGGISKQGKSLLDSRHLGNRWHAFCPVTAEGESVMPVDYPLRRVGGDTYMMSTLGGGWIEANNVPIGCVSVILSEGGRSNIADVIYVGSHGISARATSSIMTQAWPPGRATRATPPPPTGATHFYAKSRQEGDDNRDCELDARASLLRL